MKKLIINTFFTAGISTAAVSMIAILSGGQFLCISTVLSILGASVIIHLGMLLTQRFECQYALFEYLLDFVFVCAVLTIFGVAFQWFSSIPIWIIIIIGGAVYFLCVLLSLIRIQKDITEINALLKSRNK